MSRAIEKPDLIILDLMMPEMGGYEFMRAFSKEAETPVIMLTAKVEDQDKILGLELGADDYVTKPFNVRELIARVRAVLRRTQKAATEPDVLRAADIVLDRSRAHGDGRRPRDRSDAIGVCDPGDADGRAGAGVLAPRSARPGLGRGV